MAAAFPRTLGLLAVGVNDCGLQPILLGAERGVDEICQWARGQQTTYGITLHEKRFPASPGDKVRLADVQEAGIELVGKALDVLIIYLSGHGIVKTGDDEHVLLSNVTTQPQQAISVQATISAAWLCGVPYVIVISDACRSPAVANSLVGNAFGAPILFRSPTALARALAVDVFYAAGPMAPAYEVNGDGLLSSELNSLLAQPPAQAVSTISFQGVTASVIRPRDIESLLAEAIEERALNLTPPVSLQPDFRITSAVKQALFMSLTSASPAPAQLVAAALEGVIKPDAAIARTAFARNKRMSSGLDEGLHEAALDGLDPAELQRPAPGADIDPLDRQIAKRLGWLRKPDADLDCYRVRDFGPPPPRAGLLIDGVSIASIDSHAAPVQVTRISADAAWIVLAPGAESANACVLLDFESGTTAVLPIRQGLVGRVKVIEGLVQSLSFDRFPQLSPAAGVDETLPRVRMLLEQAARQGSLARLAPLLAARLPGAMATLKGIDPVLGILAAYAYELNGMQTAGAELAAQIRASGGGVPLDVSMLTGAQALADGVFGAFPLLSLGWSVAGGTGALDRLPAVVQALASARLNALWTTLRTGHAAMSDFRQAFQRGEIS